MSRFFRGPRARALAHLRSSATALFSPRTAPLDHFVLLSAADSSNEHLLAPTQRGGSGHRTAPISIRSPSLPLSSLFFLFSCAYPRLRVLSRPHPANRPRFKYSRNRHGYHASLQFAFSQTPRSMPQLRQRQMRSGEPAARRIGLTRPRSHLAAPWPSLPLRRYRDCFALRHLALFRSAGA